MRKILFLSLLVILAGGTALLKACATPPPMPTFEDAHPKDANDKPPSIDELMNGYELYVNKCSGCHILYQPMEFGDALWKEKVAEMAPKSKIDDEQKRLILLYLQRLNYRD